MAEQVCPLCRTAKHMRKAKPLYSVPVCKKCYYRFANRRQGAYVIDVLLLYVFSFFLGLATAGTLFALEFSDDQVHFTVTVLGWTVIPLMFFMKDGFAGHSPGKLICGVQVVDRQTRRPTGFGRSFMRNLPLLIPFMPLIIAFLLQKGYRIGDRWAKTKVIWKRYANHPVFAGGLACENCQYDLAGNQTGVCPECGTNVPTVAHPPVGALGA